jgi:spore germination protein
MSQINNQEKVTPYQTYVLLISTIIGTGILSLPRRMSEDVGNDGVWVIFLTGAMVWVIIMIITILGQRFPQQSFVEYSQTILSSRRYRWVGRTGQLIVVFIMILSWLIVLALITRVFGEVVVSTILQKTPLEFILFSYLLFAIPIAGSKVELVTKFNELLFPFIFVPIIISIIALVQLGDTTNLLPLFVPHPRQVFKAVYDSFFDFGGYNILLIFMASYQQLNGAKKRHTWALIGIAILYCFTVAASYAIFGSHASQRLLWPTLENIRPIYLPIQIFERLESPMISVWMVVSFTTLVNVFSALVDTFVRTFQMQESNRKWTATILILPIFVLSLLPKNVRQLNIVVPNISFYLLSVDIVLPLLLLIIAIIRKKKGGQIT